MTEDQVEPDVSENGPGGRDEEHAQMLDLTDLKGGERKIHVKSTWKKVSNFELPKEIRMKFVSTNLIIGDDVHAETDNHEQVESGGADNCTGTEVT